MAGPEHIIEEATPLVRKLIESHHPDWSPDDVEAFTHTATPAILDFIDEVLDLPEDPNVRKSFFQQASDRFNSRLRPTPEVE